MIINYNNKLVFRLPLWLWHNGSSEKGAKNQRLLEKGGFENDAFSEHLKHQPDEDSRRGRKDPSESVPGIRLHQTLQVFFAK